jgi:hypothetical protein
MASQLGSVSVVAREFGRARGANGSVLMRIEREHLGDPLSGFRLAEVVQVGSERNDVVAAIGSPGSFETVRQLLGHKSLKATVGAYAGIDSRRAARQHQRLIEAALAARTPMRRPRDLAVTVLTT